MNSATETPYFRVELDQGIFWNRDIFAVE